MSIEVKIEGLERFAQSTRRIQDAIKNELRAGLYASAKKIEGDAKKSILSGQKSGRIYNRRRKGKAIGEGVRFEGGQAVREGGFRAGFHRASAPGEAPASDTGRLANSIHSELVAAALEAIVRAGGGLVKYAHMLEFGTSKVAARPFFQPAAEMNRRWIAERLKIAVARGIAKR